MKKKLSLMFLFLLIVPVAALFGCNEVSYYSVVAHESSYHGSTMGSGSYADGSTVTLTASAKDDSYVIGWLYQNSLIISNDGTYTITNTVENEKVVKSTLSFTASSTTQGNYTALFDEENLHYTRFSGVMLSTQEDATPTDEDGFSQDSQNLPVNLPSVNLQLYQGTNPSQNIYNQESLIFKEQGTKALKISVETKTALWLKPDKTPQQISATCNVDNAQFNLRTNLSYRQTQPWPKSANGIAAKITYQNKEYQITFRFTKSGQTYYLTLFYENLK